MSTVIRAAIYARISQDHGGDGLGVQRQIEDCSALAAARGWSVSDTYVDNDLSAYSGVRRPEYERMLEDIARGRLDAILAYHQDRLTRRPIEFEQFAETCRVAGLKHFATVTSDIQLGSDDGLFTARILAAVAAQESSRKSARTKRRILQKAEQGLPNGGSIRPFGYERDRVTVIESEAAVIRAAVRHFLAGDSMASIVERWIESGIQTVAGGTWRTVTLRQIITNPRYAGLRQLNGEVVGPAIWQPIITQLEHEQVIAEHNRRLKSGWKPVRRHVLTGLLRCGLCNARLYSSSRSGRRIYRCQKSYDHDGCGGITVSAVPLEELVVSAVLLRLDSPALESRARPASAGQVGRDDVHSRLDLAERKLLELATMWSDGEISREEWKTARVRLEDRVKRARQELSRLGQLDPLAELRGQATTIRSSWDALPLTRQAAIVGAVLDHAQIMPSAPTRTLDPNRVRPVWRV